MITDIINYSVRILIILIGIIFLTGFFMPEEMDKTLLNVMGVVFILFGIYRVLLYRSNKKRYTKRYEDDK